MSKFGLHNQLVEIPLQGNRRLATLKCFAFDEVNQRFRRSQWSSFVFLHAAACGAYEWSTCLCRRF